MSRMSLFIALVWSMLCLFTGFALAPQVLLPKPEAAQTAQAHHHEAQYGEHMHAIRNLPAQAAPVLSMRVEKDEISGWNLRLDVTRFDFAPDRVNQRDRTGEGHAHLYINGTKTARLYGPNYHIGDLPPGEYIFTVSLNSNDHAALAVNDIPIEVSQKIVQQAAGM